MKTWSLLGISVGLALSTYADAPAAGRAVSAGGTFSRPAATFSRPASAAPAASGGAGGAVVNQGAPFGGGFSPIIRAPNSWWFFQGLPPGFPIDRVNLNPKYPYLAGYYANLAHGYNQLIHQYPHLAPLVAQLANENPYLNNIGPAGYYQPFYGVPGYPYLNPSFAAPYSGANYYPSYDFSYLAPQYNYILPAPEGGLPMMPAGALNGLPALPPAQNIEQPVIVNFPPGSRIRRAPSTEAAAPVSAPAPAPKMNPIVTAER